MPPASPDARVRGLLHALAQLARPARFDALAPTHDGLRYSAVARHGVPPLCDVYLPRGAGPHPSVVVVHGGGFAIGHRRMKPVSLLATRLCRAGFAVCSVDYRLVLRGGGLDEQLTDVSAAALFWRSSSARFGCDPARISLLGFSAGAALALLHAAASDHRYHRLVSIYGALEFHGFRGRPAELFLWRLLGTRDRKRWEERSPGTHAFMPTPLLTIHGADDDLVSPAPAQRLHEARLARGLPSEHELVPGMRHGFLNDASLPQTEQALVRVLGFLRG